MFEGGGDSATSRSRADAGTPVSEAAEVAGVASSSCTTSADLIIAGRALHDAELTLARNVAGWVAVEGWKVDGARSATAWLMWKLGMSHARAGEIVRLGQTLVTEPLIAAALDEGRLSLCKARPIIAAGTAERTEAFGRDLAVMIRNAESLTAGQTRAMVEHWANLANLADEAREQQDEKPVTQPTSKLHAAETIDGIVEVNGTLHGDHGALLRAALEAAKRLGQPDDADNDPEAQHETGAPKEASPPLDSPATDTPPADSPPLDTRTESEKNADVLAPITRFFLDHHTNIGSRQGERAHVTVTIDLEALTSGTGQAETTNLRAGLTAEQARQIACDCKVVRILTIGPSDIIDVGRTQQVIPVALRRALTIRDKHCRAPGCTMPAIFCDAHHIVHWINDGPTTLENCTLVCGHHHTQHHKGNLTISGDPHHTLTFTTRTGAHHTTRPPGQLDTG